MKILKKGKKQYKEIKFTCSVCECVFVACEQDYVSTTDPKDRCKIFICGCPECNNLCRKYMYDERGESERNLKE